MKFSVRSLIIVALVIVYIAEFRGMRYFIANGMQEVGLLITLMLFVYSATLAALNDKAPGLQWSKWFFVPIIFIIYIMVLPAYLWNQQTGAPMLPSVLAAREYFIVLLCPTLYFLYRIGLSFEDIENSVYIGLIVIVFIYILVRFTAPLEQWWVSSDPNLKSLIAWDPIRGYRLQMPGTAFTMALTIAPIRFLRENSNAMKLLWLATFIAAMVGIILMQGRSMIASLFLGIIFYHLFFAERNRMAVFCVALPGILFGMYLMLDYFFKMVEELYLSGHGIRFVSYNTAVDAILKHPVLGVGMNSKQSISETMVFGETFDSSDLGLIGIAFRYGILGASLYLFCALWVVVRAVRGGWLYKDIHGQSSPLFLAITAKVSIDAMNLVLSNTYATISGLLMASIVIALSAMIVQEKQKAFAQAIQA